MQSDAIMFVVMFTRSVHVYSASIISLVPVNYEQTHVSRIKQSSQSDSIETMSTT